MKRLFTILATILLIAGLAQADWFFNPFTGKLDYFLAASSSPAYGDMGTATGDGTTTFDWGDNNYFSFTFGAQNETFTFTAPADKGRIILVIKQDATGSRTITWPGTVLWPGGIAPTLSTGANAVDIVALFWDGTSYYGLFNGDFQ